MDKRGFACCRHNCLTLLTSAKLWALLILAILCYDRYLAPIRTMLIAENLRIGWADLAVFLLNDSLLSVLTALGLLLLLFDFPLRNDAQKYLLLRSGRRAWARGQLYTILIASAAYLAVLGLILLMWILPWLEISPHWSSGILFFTDGASEIYDSFLNYDPWIIRAYSPLGALCLEVLLHFICFAALGFLMCIVNAAVHPHAGFLIAAAPVLADTVLTQYFPDFINYFSPLTLTRLSCLDYGDGMLRPTPTYAAAALTVLALLLGRLFVFICGRKEIHQ